MSEAVVGVMVLVFGLLMEELSKFWSKEVSVDGG
jgi:hypothetical protein